MSERSLSIRVRIEGRVQGVSYRASTQARAQRLGVVGWVKNLPEGAVEAHIEGQESDVKALLAWCEEGPPRAHVAAVTWVNAPREHAAHFEVRT